MTAMEGEGVSEGALRGGRGGGSMIVWKELLLEREEGWRARRETHSCDQVQSRSFHHCGRGQHQSSELDVVRIG